MKFILSFTVIHSLTHGEDKSWSLVLHHHKVTYTQTSIFVFCIAELLALVLEYK